jgi:superfamily II DNA or RNA helicase
MNKRALYDWRSGKVEVWGNDDLDSLMQSIDGARRYRGKWRVPVESVNALLALSDVIDTSEITHLANIKPQVEFVQHGATLPVAMKTLARKIGGNQINGRWYFDDPEDVDILHGAPPSNGSVSRIDPLRALRMLGPLDKPLPNGWKLYQHQQDTVKSVLSTSIKGKVIALDFGGGKTLCTNVIVRGLQKAYNLRALAIVPASLKENWRREMSGLVDNPTIVSDHYSAIPDNYPHPFVLIADEAHRLAGESQRGDNFIKLASQARFVIPLTGVPVRHGNPETAYNMLRAIGHPTANMDRKVFASRYSGSESLVKDFYNATNAYIIRIKKRDMLDLPPKTRVIRQVEVSPLDLQLYERIYKEKQREYWQGVKEGEKRAQYFNSALVHYIRQAASLSKVRTTVEIVEELLEQDRQVVLFVAYRATGRELWEQLHQYGMSVITGGTPVKDRQQMVDDFQSGKRKVALCTYGAAGFGLTLTKGDTNILVDRPFSVESGDTDNAESRIDRIGQLSPTTMVWLQFIHPEYKSPDVRLDQLITDKYELNELALSGKAKRLEFADGLGDYMASYLFE